VAIQTSLGPFRFYVPPLRRSVNRRFHSGVVFSILGVALSARL
jgi:hypothetical protein